MYHSISGSVETGWSPYFQVTTTPAVFEAHLEILAENGYSCPPLRGINESTSATPAKKVILTFDDGFADFYFTAWPVMRKHGFSGTVFLPTDFIDSQENQLIPGKKHLSWEQVTELSHAGVEFGSHSVTHSILRKCSRDVIRNEIRSSKQRIEEHLDTPVESFSYPYAFPFDDDSLTRFLEACVSEAGYRYAVSTRIGVDNVNKNRIFRPRLPMNNLDDKRFFLGKIQGAYDWVTMVQYVYRHVNTIKSMIFPKRKNVYESK
jgi:peptidoglycan/xylan/chitin deacetylase (PgdA/CDA1 family)